ncbi:MAG: glycosyltransferase [Acidimicrobiia bacterium]
MARIRLLYVIDSVAAGGAERSLAALAPHYRDLGVDLTVVTLVDRQGVEQQLLDAGARLLSVASAKGRSGKLRALRALVREERPDLVHTTLFEADILGRTAARLAGTPVVSSLVNTAYGAEHAAEQGIRKSRLRGAQALDAVTARFTRRLHAVSENVAEVMAERLHYPSARIDVVPRGRDPEVLGRRTATRRAAVRADLGVADDEHIVLAVARHEPQKGLDVLVRAITHVRGTEPRTRLLIAGRDGNATADLRATLAACSMEADTVLLGERSDIGDLLSAADVFVLPSYREGMPGAVIEALALEVPVVASDIPQVREVTADRAALLVTPGNVDGFADAIQQCIEDQAAAASRAEDGYVRFTTCFTVQRTAAMMVQFYERALGATGEATTT